MNVKLPITSYQLPITNNQIMQNKPNFQKAKMNLNLYSTKDYENESRLQKPKNKPKQTQFAKCSNEHKLLFNKGL